MWTVALEGGPRRVNHAAVNIGDKVYSFGGYCSGETMDPEQPIDIHVLNTDTYRWQYLKVEGSSQDSRESSVEPDFDMDTSEDDLMEDGVNNVIKPAPHPYQRYGHTVVAYNGKAYIWGGRNDESGASSTLHEFDTVTRAWRIVPVTGRVPPARDGHSAVVVGDKMYLFGGFEEDAQIFSQETYVFDFPSGHWSRMHTYGSPPIWRDFHTAVALNGKMYVFGGRSDQMGQYHSTRDVYCDRLKALDLKTGEWSDPMVRGQRPSGRRSHSAWTYGGRMYIFGGFLGTINKHFDDLFCYDPKTSYWTKIDHRGIVAAPCARRRQCTVVVKDRVFLFGGTMPINGNENVGNAGGLADLADLYVFDYAPSLLHLSARTVISNGQSKRFSSVLPEHLRRELHFMTHPNEITNPPMQRHDVAG